HLLVLHSFPTRRSSDLVAVLIDGYRPPRTFGLESLERFYCFIGVDLAAELFDGVVNGGHAVPGTRAVPVGLFSLSVGILPRLDRSEEHTSELQSRENLV